jgi:eukaryotic-like serine/threonine-protein kinase
VVYRAPNVTTTFAASMVYKEYKPAALTGIDFTALAAMPALVEDTLAFKEAERLISVAAWPCALVHDGQRPTGFVMPVIPEQFFTSLTTVKGTTTATAEFQHLLNHSTVLAARGLTLDDTQRCTLLREVASTLAFLHKHGVCIGDISPKNLLYALTPHEAVYFIDCDAMRIDEVSALTQVETPGWEVPPGEELATIYSDTYKLGLLALRLLAGDHDTTSPGHLPATTPTLLRQIITDTLTNPAHHRPLPEAWSYVLGHAIEETQHRTLAAAAATTELPVTALAAPEVPTVRSRPTGTTPAPRKASKTAPRTPTPIPGSTPPRPQSTNRPSAVLIAIGTIGGVVIVIAVIAAIIGQSHNTSPTAYTQSTYTPPATPPPPPAPAPVLDPEAASLQQLQQLAADDRSYVSAQLADRWIPQLSSKRPGVVDDGVVWNNSLTLQEHLRLRQQYGAKLLWSGDWTNFDAPDFWVTVVPITFSDSADALAWCRGQGLDPDHCYAEVVSTTRSGYGSTAHN